MSHKHIQHLLVPLSCLILLLFQLILAFKLPTLNCVEIEKEIIANNGIIYQLRWPLTTSAQTVLELLSADEQFSSFVELLDKQSIKLLNSTDAVTVFAFTNSIFSSLSPSLQSKMRRGCAKDVIKNHIYESIICLSNSRKWLKAINGITHNISTKVINGTVFKRVGNARLFGSNRIASNGIIHTIDDIILSKEFMDWREKMIPSDENFLDLIERNIKNNSKPYAIFIPPYKNFSSETDFILNHIVLDGRKITNGSITTSYNSKIPSVIAGTNSIFGCAHITKTPIQLCETIIYFISEPLPIVTKNLLEIINDRKEFSTFSNLLKNSSLTELLADEQKIYMILLPSNDALSANLVKVLTGNNTFAHEFVRSHILKDFICSKNLNSMANGSTVSKIVKNIDDCYYNVREINGNTAIGNSIIQDGDVIAKNGIIHVVDSPLQVINSYCHRP